MSMTCNEKITEFFKSPNGTIFMEGDVFAVKIPVGPDPRYGMIMIGSLYGSPCKSSIPYPRRDFELSADSYVDNQTGLRILCDSFSEFKFRLHHKDDPITYSNAVSEVQAGIHSYLEQLPDDRLFLAAMSAGEDPGKAMTISDHEHKQLQHICERSYALGEDPEYPYDPYHKADIDPRNINAAEFAIFYLRDKEQLIRDQAEAALPMCADTLLHSRALAREQNRLQESIEADPPVALQKERSIREAIAGKSSIWATFSNGNDTLRMSIPTSAFTNDHRLSSFQLTERNRDKLETFLFPDKAQRWGAYVQMDHIVALEYKNNLVFIDREFYDHLPTQSQEKVSVSDRLKDASERAAQQKGQQPTQKSNDWRDINEL